VRSSILLGSGRDQTSINVRLSVTKRGESAREDVGTSNEIPQRFLVRIGNHESFRRAFCPASRLNHGCRNTLTTRQPDGLNFDIQLESLEAK
jgi:hypothetical protein